MLFKSFYFIIVGILIVVATLFALANRLPVTVHVFPDFLALLLHGQVKTTLPLFVVIFGFFAFGGLMGFLYAVILGQWVQYKKNQQKLHHDDQTIKNVKHNATALALTKGKM